MSSPRGDAANAPRGGRRRFSVDALFTDHRPQATGVVDLPTAKEILLDRIVPDPDQPRRTFDPDKLDELAASIRIEGILQPIVVRYDAPNDTYVVVHGERRWRAAGLAGLDRLPAIVRDVPLERRLIQQLMENIVRDDLNAVDRAGALRALKVQLDDAPWEHVAEAVGIRRSRLFQLLGTEKLPEPIQEDIRTGRLSEKQSRALQGLAPAAQEALRTAIVADGLPAGEAMRLARDLRTIELPDEPGAAVAAIHRLRETATAVKPVSSDPRRPAANRPQSSGVASDAPEPTSDELALLAAVTAAAGGGRSERQGLRRAADAAGAPSFEEDRLRSEVLALARSLARAPGSAFRPGGPGNPSLVALWRALDALLNEQ